MVIWHSCGAATKRCVAASFALWLAAFTPIAEAGAQPTGPDNTLHAPPTNLYRVVDQADLISLDNEKLLVQKLVALEVQAGPQLVIVTVRSLEGKPIEDVSLMLAQSWAIGSVERKDGVLLLVAPNEKQVRIEVGSGLKAVLDNSFCAWIIRENMLPLLQNGDMQGAIIAGTDQLIARLQQNPTRPQA